MSRRTIKKTPIPNKPSSEVFVTQQQADKALAEMQELLDEMRERASDRVKEVYELMVTDRISRDAIPDIRSLAMAVWYEALQHGYDHVFGEAFAGSFMYGYCTCEELTKLKVKLAGGQ